eukprot:g16855.t1
MELLELVCSSPFCYSLLFSLSVLAFRPFTPGLSTNPGCGSTSAQSLLGPWLGTAVAQLRLPWSLGPARSGIPAWNGIVVSLGLACGSIPAWNGIVVSLGLACGSIPAWNGIVVSLGPACGGIPAWNGIVVSLGLACGGIS